MLKHKISLLFAILAFVSFFGACSKRPYALQDDIPLANPNAPVAFFGEGNASDDMRSEYAFAMQKAGFCNFIMENFSEKQLENPIEIRLEYNEERGKFTGIPTLILKAEFLKDGELWFKFSLRESSDKDNLQNMRQKNAEKKYRQQVLLERFLEEVKRVRSEEPSENHKG